MGSPRPFDTTRDLDTGNFNYVVGQHINRYKVFPGDSFDAWWNLIADIHDHAKDLREEALKRLRQDYNEVAALSSKRFEGWTREYNKRKALEKELQARTAQAKFWCDLYDKTDIELRAEINALGHASAVDAPYRETFWHTKADDLEQENRELGDRILDLTKKLTTVSDARDELQRCNIRLVREKIQRGGYAF